MAAAAHARFGIRGGSLARLAECKIQPPGDGIDLRTGRPVGRARRCRSLPTARQDANVVTAERDGTRQMGTKRRAMGIRGGKKRQHK